MENLEIPGQVNAAILGLVLRETVRRAIQEVKQRRWGDQISPLAPGITGRDTAKNSVRAAQGIYLSALTKCFPEYGIVAQDDSLLQECRLPSENVYFAVNPLDDPAAFSGRHSFGIGTAVALVIGEKVVSAYAGDVCTGEIYGYRPGLKPARFDPNGTETELSTDPNRLLAHQTLLMNGPLESYSPVGRSVVQAFEKYEISNVGSLAMAFARLWNREVGGIMLRPSPYAPWGTAPILGICEALGIVFLELNRGSGTANLVRLPVSKDIVPCGFDLLAIPSSRISEIKMAGIVIAQ